MKHIKNRWLGLAILPALALFAMASSAQATSYTCANVPATVNGDATIGTAGTACVIPAAGVNASGNISVSGTTISTTGNITAAGTLNITGSSTISVKALSGASINVVGPSTVATTTMNSTNGSIDVTSTGAITATTVAATDGHVDFNAQGTAGDTNATSLSASNGYVKAKAGRKVNISGVVQTTGTLGARNILIVAQTTVKTGNVTGAAGANIVVKANKGGGTTALVIGTPGLNGIGTVTAGANGAIYITNSTSGTVANISLTNTNRLVTTSGGNTIILDAQAGVLTIPAGTLSTATSAGQIGGIQLLAGTVNFSGATTLRANHTGAGTRHGVAIAATTVNHNGLTINANGTGDLPNGSFVYFQPRGATVVTDNNEDVSNLFINVNNLNPNNVIGASNVVSAGGLLKATANGDNAAIITQAYPLSFKGGPVTFEAKGKTNHLIYIRNNGQTSGTQGVTFSGGAVILDASAEVGGNGGEIRFFGVDKATLSSPTFLFNVNGPPSGNGNAGRVDLGSAKSIVLSATSAATITADAAPAGTGGPNASGYRAIDLQPGANNIILGTGNGKYKLSAKGGANGGGDGGYINVFVPGPQTITFDSGLVADASSPGANGNAGTVYINGRLIAPAGTSSQIKADGGTTQGNGGKIHLLGNESLNLGLTSGLNLSAKAAGTGNANTNRAGMIEIAYANIVNLDGAGVDLSTGGNASGGIINIHDITRLTVTAASSLRANAAGTGKGGNITLNQTAYNPMTLTNATISATGGCNPVAECGSIAITSPATIEATKTKFRVDGAGLNKGGEINLIGNSGKITLDEAEFNASGGQTGGGAGGFIHVNNNSAEISVAQLTMSAIGFVDKAGGQIRLTTDSAHPIVSDGTILLDAKGGASGEGGLVIIPFISQLSNNPTGPFVPNSLVKVESGLTSSGSFGGSVTWNGITCQRQLTGYSWPKFYWNCVNPGSPSSLDGRPALTASQRVPGGMHAQLVNTNIYVFANSTALQSFLNVTFPGVFAGYTYPENGPTPYINATVLENTVFPSGYATLTTDQISEAAIHEIGHAIDLSGGVSGVTSGSAIFTALVSDDLDYLDKAGGAVNVPPCTATGSGPLNGVIDFQTHQQFCSAGGTGGTLNNPGGIYTGKTNSQIVALSQPGILASQAELFAQVFAYQAFVRNLTNQTDFFLTETADGLMKKGLYSCAQSIGAQAAGVAFTPAYSCP